MMKKGKKNGEQPRRGISAGGEGELEGGHLVEKEKEGAVSSEEGKTGNPNN